MATIKKTAEEAVGRAKAAVVQAKRQGGELAAQLAKKKSVKRAAQTAARLRGRAVVLAKDVADKVTGRAKKRKKAKVVAAVVGAAAVAAAARRQTKRLRSSMLQSQALPNLAPLLRLRVFDLEILVQDVLNVRSVLQARMRAREDETPNLRDLQPLIKVPEHEGKTLISGQAEVVDHREVGVCDPKLSGVYVLQVVGVFDFDSRQEFSGREFDVPHGD